MLAKKKIRGNRQKLAYTVLAKFSGLYRVPDALMCILLEELGIHNELSIVSL